MLCDISEMQREAIFNLIMIARKSMGDEAVSTQLNIIGACLNPIDSNKNNSELGDDEEEAVSAKDRKKK